MKLKDILDVDLVNYKSPVMFLATCSCTWKCCKEAGIPITVCQNEPIYHQPTVEVPADEIFRRYLENKITNAVVFGGLEPMLQFNEMLEVIKTFRDNGCNDDIVIYTGYYESEIQNQIELLCEFPNIILKVGRFILDQESHFDDVLGVKLASPNQYAVKIS